MVYYILNYFVWIVGQYAANYILLSSFDFKKRKANRLIHALILMGIILPFGSSKYFFADYSLIRDLSLLGILTVSIVYMHYFMKGRLWQKILFVVLQEVAFWSGEIFVILLFNEQLVQSMGLDYRTPFALLFCILDTIAGLTVFTFILLLWKQIVMKRTYNKTGFFIFMLFPISQVLLTYANSQLVLSGVAINGTYNILGTIIGFLADGVLLVIILRQQHIREMDEQLAILKSIWDEAQRHYQQIEMRREELAKIRHDLQDQFLTMRELIQREEYEPVLTMLDTLTESIEGTEESPTKIDA